MKKLQHLKLAIVSLGICFATSSLADTDERLEHFLSLSLEELIGLETSIASASKRTTIKAPAMVTLITADDIKATGATNLADILQSVPGIHIRSSQFANRPLVHFRGANAKQTLLMINGNSMTDLVWGFGIFWKGVPVSAIDRIEIIRGPGSALFGADASAGVVNVITKTAAGIQQTEAGLRIGSFNSKTAWMQDGTTINGYEIGFTAEIFSTDGHSPFITADQQTRTDIDEGSNVSLAPGHATYGWQNQDIRLSVAKQHWRLQADYTSRKNVETGFTGGGALDAMTQGEDSRFNLDMFYNNARFSQTWSLDSELRYQHLDYTSGDGFHERPAGYTVGTDVYADGLINKNSSAERQVVFKISSVYSGLENHAMRLGTGYTWQDLYFIEHMVNFGTGPDGLTLPVGSPIVDISNSPYAFAPEKKRHIHHLFFEDIWSINEDWELTAGVRYDDYSDFGDTTNPRLALVWQSTDKLTTKLVYGKAFRAPNYQELFAITSFSQPNPNLDPERSETLDIGFNYAFTSNFLVNMNLFYFEQTGLIGRDGTGQYQNSGDHIIRGIELETRWQIVKDASLSANYTLRSQEESGFRLRQEADQEAYLRTDWGFTSEWNWNLQASWIGERERKPGDTRPTLNAYVITDTTLRYASSNHREFAISIRNLFNEDAREYTGGSIPDDLPLAERNLYAEMRIKF